MQEKEIKHLTDECRQIEDDCLYTAETHYIIASNAERISFWVKLIPDFKEAENK